MRYQMILPEEPPNGTKLLDCLLGVWQRSDSDLYPGHPQRWVELSTGRIEDWPTLVMTFGPLDDEASDESDEVIAAFGQAFGAALEAGETQVSGVIICENVGERDNK